MADSIGYSRLLDPSETDGQARAKLLAALRETETVIEGKVTKPGHPHFGKHVHWAGPPTFTVTKRPPLHRGPDGGPLHKPPCGDCLERTEVSVNRLYEVTP